MKTSVKLFLIICFVGFLLCVVQSLCLFISKSDVLNDLKPAGHSKFIALLIASHQSHIESAFKVVTDDAAVEMHLTNHQSAVNGVE